MKKWFSALWKAHYFWFGIVLFLFGLDLALHVPVLEISCSPVGLVLSFVGVLATFVVIGNYVQTKDARDTADSAVSGTIELKRRVVELEDKVRDIMQEAQASRDLAEEAILIPVRYLLTPLPPENGRGWVEDAGRVLSLTRARRRAFSPTCQIHVLQIIKEGLSLISSGGTLLSIEVLSDLEKEMDKWLADEFAQENSALQSLLSDIKALVDGILIRTEQSIKDDLERYKKSAEAYRASLKINNN